MAREATNASNTSEGVQARTSRWLRKVTPASSRLDPSSAGQSNERDRSMSPGASRALRAERDQQQQREASPSRVGTTGVKPVVQMTYSVILDLDLNQKSGRAERVLCHFDRSHNLKAAYHVELTWLAGSGKIIDSVIQSWIRSVGRYGLNLIEVGTREVGSKHNPFQRAVKIALCMDPPELVEGQCAK